MAEPRLRVLQYVRGSERYGASVSIKNLIGELTRRNHEVTLMSFHGRSMGAQLPDLPYVELEPFSKFSLRGIMQIRRKLQELRPDLLHTHLSAATLSGSIAARLANVPVISTVHGMNQRWTYSFSNRLITVSEAAKQHLTRQGIPARRISVAYNGIAIPSLPTCEDRKRARALLGIPIDAPVLGSISRADYGKGIQDAILALPALRRQFPGLRYIYAGEGEYLPELKEHASALGLSEHVLFLGFRDDVLDLLAALDVFLFPSLKEAMGISIVEAMAAGLPTVGTNVGGIPEVLDETCGCLVPPNDPMAVAGATRTLLMDEKLRRCMGLAARAKAQQKFSLEASVIAVEAAYGELLGLGG